MVQTQGEWNQIVYWSRLPDWKNQTLTPNPDTVYLMPFINTKDVGPVVLEIPPAVGGSITGSVDDGWQAALEDIGPAGAEKGRGGKYLILPPGHRGKIPGGYIAFPRSPSTFRINTLRACTTRRTTIRIPFFSAASYHTGCSARLRSFAAHSR
jgi:hypothetical protein